MPVNQLAHMTWEEVRDLDRGRAVAILPVGATEAHGPHLPCGTDVIIAEAMAEAGARRLLARGFEVVILPPLAFTTAEFAAGFAGTITVRPKTATALVVDVATSLHRAGFATLAIANAHLDPGHLSALHAACDAVRDRGLMTVAFPDITQRPWAARLTDEFKSGACHAGRYEGSIVMARAPDLVRDRIRRGLEPNPSSLSTAIREGKRTFREAGGPRAYFGYPAEATVEEGHETVDALGAILEEAVSEAIDNGPGSES